MNGGAPGLFTLNIPDSRKRHLAVLVCDLCRHEISLDASKFDHPMVELERLARAHVCLSKGGPLPRMPAPAEPEHVEPYRAGSLRERIERTKGRR